MAKKNSLKDIAEAAGVSVALVSYVLNNKEKEARINVDTAKKVKEIAEKMNYQPNQVAKSLKSGKSFAIGLIVADISNPFFGQLAKTIEEESNRRGYTVIVGSSDEDLEKFKRLIDTLVNRQIDGFIIAPVEGSEEQLKYLEKTGVPFVLIDRFFKNLETCYVVIDNFNAMYQVTESILKQKHDAKIGYVCYENNLQHTEDRQRGFIQAFKNRGRKDFDEFICKVKYNDPEKFNDSFTQLINRSSGIDTVLFSTNTLSIMGLKVLSRLNIKIPEELSVFCFDQSDSYDLFYCPISYVHQPLDKIGAEAVKILFDKMFHKADFLQQIVLEADIVTKQSSVFYKRKAEENLD